MMKVPTNRLLLEFLKDWLAWVESGAKDIKDGGRYSRSKGLCSAAETFGYCTESFMYPIRIKAAMAIRWGEVKFPFNKDHEDFLNEMEDGKAHLNEKRLKFVRDTIKALEAKGA